MPKSSKHKKERAADFSKAKLKLGKGKQTPNNAVDTSFKARSITLPSQTIAGARDGLGPTTKRKLTFDDLIMHLKHYNAGTRKDALLGLRELFEDHPEIISLSLTSLLNGCVRLIADEDASVRKGLISFLDWLLHRIPRDDILPHAQLLLLYTTSAQTHIFPEIRVDAIRFLDLCLEVIPEIVVEGWSSASTGHGRRIMEGYLGILNAGTAYNDSEDRSSIQATSTASVILSPASKLVVLKSLLSFLSTALSQGSCVQSGFFPSVDLAEPTSTLFMASSFTTSIAFGAFDALLQPQASGVDENWSDSVGDSSADLPLTEDSFACGGVAECWEICDLNRLETSSYSTGDQAAESSRGIRLGTAYIVHLLRTLHPILTATFLDYAPVVFSPSSTPPEIELQSVFAVARIAQHLYGATQSSLHMDSDKGLVDNLGVLVAHMTVYFPFRGYWASSTRRDMKVEQTLQDLNYVFCELTSYLMGATSHQLVDQHSKKRHVKINSLSHVSQAQIDRVSQYIVDTLKGKCVGQPVSALSRPMTAAAYGSILPTIWTLLNNTDASCAEDILGAIVEHAMQCSSTSAVKRRSIEFLGRLILLETASQYRGRFRLSLFPQLNVAIGDWLIQLPKTIWELGSQNVSCTEVVIRLLIRLIQRNSPFISYKVSCSLSARIMPYFVIDHRTHGKIPGPFNKLPKASVSRKLALDLASSLHAIGSCEGFENAVKEGCSDLVDRRYWLSIVSSSE